VRHPIAPSLLRITAAPATHVAVYMLDRRVPMDHNLCEHLLSFVFYACGQARVKKRLPRPVRSAFGLKVVPAKAVIAALPDLFNAKQAQTRDAAKILSVRLICSSR